jgi:hypothetical protein
VRSLLLFDVDGVLVEAHGYLRALQDTVAHFSRCMGVGDHPPSEVEVRALEAHGLTSEWDSGAACVAFLLLERLRRDPALSLPAVWAEALAFLGAHSLVLPNPDYAALAARIGARPRGEMGMAAGARLQLWEEAQFLPEPQRRAFAALLDQLLGTAYEFTCAPVMHYFQHLVLGHEGVAATYGAVPDFESVPYLRTYDLPLLDEAARTQVLNAVQAGQVGAVIYTARPSLPPAGVADSPLGYSSEAEAARALVGLEPLPLIGLGRLQWLASRTGESAEALVKPSPVQALAAIGAAVSGDEVAALEAALRFHREGLLLPPLSDLGETVVHVFEDTPGGLRAVQHAAALLQEAGLPMTVQPYGIAPAESPKAALIAELGAPVFPSINHALAFSGIAGILPASL